MADNITPFGNGSPNDPFSTELDFLPDLSEDYIPETQQAQQEEDDDELDVGEFRRLIENFISSPIDLVNSPAIAKFIQWINYDGAEDILGQYNILRRYNNEPDCGVWIQKADLDFTKGSKFDVDNFRYMNCGKPKEHEKFLAKNNFMVNYWQIKEHPASKLRKYYHPTLPLCVIVQYEEVEPPRKKPKLTQHVVAAQVLSATAVQSVNVNYDSTPVKANFNHSNISPETNNYYSNYSAQFAQLSPSSVALNNTNHEWNYNVNVDSGYMINEPVQLTNNTNLSQYGQHSNPSSIDDTSDANSTPNNVEDPYVKKEEYVFHHEAVTARVDQLEYQVKQNTDNLVDLTASFVNLTIQTVQNTNELDNLSLEIVELHVEINRELCTAFLTVCKEQNWYAPVGKNLNKVIRKMLNRTQEQLPNAQITNFVYLLLKKRILKPRNPDDVRWELDVEMAKKYGLLK